VVAVQGDVQPEVLGQVRVLALPEHRDIVADEVEALVDVRQRRAGVVHVPVDARRERGQLGDERERVVERVRPVLGLLHALFVRALEDALEQARSSAIAREMKATHSTVLFSAATPIPSCVIGCRSRGSLHVH
jgi:hypothetical protein